MLAVAGVTVAGPFSRVLARLGARDLVPRVPGRWRLSVACWFSGAAWLVALTPRSSGRVRVTPFRRRAPKPWAHLPITVAPHVLSVSIPGTQILPDRSDNYRSSTTDQQNRQLFSTPRRPSTAARELFVWIATSKPNGDRAAAALPRVLGGALIPPAFTRWSESARVGPGGRKFTRAPRRPSAPRRPTAGRHTSGSGCRAAPSPGALWGSAPSIAAGTAAGR